MGVKSITFGKSNFYNKMILPFTIKFHLLLFLEKPSWTSFGYWLRFYRHRIIRLWPAYLYILSVVTFRSSTQTYHSVWPFTDPYIQCSKYWWHNLLFINIFTNTQCLGWTWLVYIHMMYF